MDQRFRGESFFISSFCAWRGDHESVNRREGLIQFKEMVSATRQEMRKAAFVTECSLSETGSPGRIRTGDLSINSRMLYR
jgi:hypothetical protein